MLNVELTRFKVKAGKSEKVTEWLMFLNEHMSEVLLTLADEKMYVETIFREKNESGEYLYWYSIQGEGGISVESSSHEVDKKHIEYWEECIDESIKPMNMSTEVVMIDHQIMRCMK